MILKMRAAFVLAGMTMALTITAAATPNVSGKWSMTIEGGPHGKVTMGLALQQEGKKVSGTFATGHADLPVTGEFVDGTLKLESGTGDSQVTLEATLKADGTLSGYLSSSRGDMNWTATRVPERRDKSGDSR